MKEHLGKNRIIYSIIISGVQSILLGIYLALYSDQIINGKDLLEALQKTKQFLPLLVVTLILFLFQIYLGVLENIQSVNDKELLINNILRAACSTLIYPASNLHIRAIITVCDYKKKTRQTKYSYNIESAPERTAVYDLDFGVTGEAVIKKAAIAQALPPNHMETYTDNNAKYVDPDLKCVLAAPIFSLKHKNKVLAVLAFDSTEDIKKVKFNTRKSKEIAQMWADILSHIIK